MPEVNVEIDGKKYRMACEDGQEAHLMELAERFNRTVLGLKGSFGEIGDNRLVVMAGIAVLDELAAAEDRIEADTRTLLAERAKFASELDKVSAKAKRLDDTSAEVARRLVVAMETVNEVLRDA